MASEVSIHFAKAISDVAIFLEYTSTDLLNEDASVEAMEQLASELQLLNPIEKLALVRQLKTLAPSYTEPSHREFVTNLPDALGLIE